MSEQQPTGNPVFDYRADFRAFALKLQRALLLGGAVVFVVCAVMRLLRPLGDSLCMATALGSAAGLALLGGGVAWGFYWRRKIRREFRERYGPE